MAKAVRSLSPKQIAESSQLLRQAVAQLARLAAKRAVQTNLRDQGVRVSLFPYAELMRLAAEYLDKHPELYQQALERAQRLGYVNPLGAEVKTSAQTQSEPISTTSTVQISGAEWMAK